MCGAGPERFMTTTIDGGSHHEMAHDGQFRTMIQYSTRDKERGTAGNLQATEEGLSCMSWFSLLP